jgi:biopolymer transport protein ExbB/TolQ
MAWGGVQALYQQGGLTLVGIVWMSVVSLAVGLERVWSVWVYRRRLRVSSALILGHLQQRRTTMAQAVNASMPAHPGAAVFALVLGERVASLGEVRRLQHKILRAVRSRVWLVGSMGALAPFVGLMGTVVGVMQAFRSIGEQGAGGFQTVSAGISEALVATAGGIMVGIEAVLLFNYLQVLIGHYAAELKEAVEEMGEWCTEASDGAEKSNHKP